MDRVKGSILPPTNVTWTCSQGQKRMLDFAVVSTQIAPMVKVTASVTDLNILAVDPRVWHSLVIGPVVTGYKYNTDITHCVLN